MKPILKLLVPGALALLVAMGGIASSPAPASADSCWWHNGTLMRLKDRGNQRWFLYEDPRKRWMRAAGVRRGTLLFNGVKNGNSYSGTARRFSKYCPGDPLEYHVSGPVSPNQTRVTVSGNRPIHSRCRPTGAVEWDTLVFTYSHQC